VQSSPARSVVLYPGAVILKPGRYRVSHSITHHSDAEIYLFRGIFLPKCPVAGCKVSFKLVAAKVRAKAA
jgi:hypothetical protein